jgi:hypothetical protein
MPQTPEEQHAKEMNEWAGGINQIKLEIDANNGEENTTETEG